MSQKVEMFSSVTKSNLDGPVHTQRPSYNATRRTQEKRPTKDQAIVLTTADPGNLHVTPYYTFIRAVANIVGPQNILAASKIPGSKFCIFLSSQELAKKFQEDNPTIQVNDIEFHVSPYIQPAAKLVLCNTWPFIPNSVFEEALDRALDRAIMFISPIKDVAMGFLDKEYRGIAFFKRYIFIQSTDSKNIVIPDYLIVTYEGTTYKVYLEIENKCKKCQGPHPANKCPTDQTSGEQENSDLQIRLNKVKESSYPSPIIPINKDTDIIEDTNQLEPQPTHQSNQNEENIKILTKEQETYQNNNEEQHLMEITEETNPTLTPKTPINENNKRIIEQSPTEEPKFKKSGKNEEEEIFEISSNILNTRPDIMIDPQEITRLWMDLKGKQNKRDILQNFNHLHSADLFHIFDGIQQHPDTPKNYRNRAKKIATLLYEHESDASVDSSNSLNSQTD